jgi:hypothetical protein
MTGQPTSTFPAITVNVPFFNCLPNTPLSQACHSSGSNYLAVVFEVVKIAEST